MSEYSSNSPIRVLVVEDHELARSGLCACLGKAPEIKIVGSVKNGKEAVDFTLNHAVDLVLMDIRMPEIDGVQCIEIIKDSYPQIKIIVLTTFDDDEYVFNALKNGASGYLLKVI